MSIGKELATELRNLVRDLKSGGGPKLRTTTMRKRADGSIETVRRRETISEVIDRVSPSVPGDSQEQ